MQSHLAHLPLENDIKFDPTKLTNLSPTPRKNKKIVQLVLPNSDLIREEELPQNDFWRRKKRIWKILFLLFLFVLYIAYFSAVLIIHSKIEDNNYWCDGDGLLIIITFIALVMVSYFKGFKPFFGKKFKLKIIRPIKKKLEPYFEKWYLGYFSYILAFSVILAYILYDSSEEKRRLISFAGIISLLLFGLAFSEERRKIKWTQIIWGIGLQYLLGILIFNWAIGKAFFHCFAGKVQKFLQFTDVGSTFVFGELSADMAIFAFKVLSVIIFFSFCIQILYYYGAMQWIVIKLGWFLQKTMGTTACESISTAANIFLGMAEAPLMIKPYISLMTKSELHAIMTGGFATISGSVLVAYISFGIDAAFILSASIMSAPAALAFSKLFYPEQEVSVTKSKDIKIEKGNESNVLHAAIEGVSNAIPLVAHIAANLIAVISFVALINYILNWSCLLINIEDGVCSLSNLFGYTLIPLAWVMGVPWVDCHKVAKLIGTKVMLNEFMAYVDLVELKRNNDITKRAEIIATFALCGFSNISNIGTVLGSLGAMAPHRKGEMATIVVKAITAANVASFLTACVAGTLFSSLEYEESYFNKINTTSMQYHST